MVVRAMNLIVIEEKVIWINYFSTNENYLYFVSSRVYIFVSFTKKKNYSVLTNFSWRKMRVVYFGKNLILI